MSRQHWTLRVLRAFRDAMNDDKPADVPECRIGWPHRGMNEGPYQPFVWFDRDPITFGEELEQHEGLEVVIGVICSNDPSKVGETELEQAIDTFYGMRQTLAEAAHDDDSHFNHQFDGAAFPDPQQGGVRPSDGKHDFDGRCVIGERWKVIGSASTVGADDA